MLRVRQRLKLNKKSGFLYVRVYDPTRTPPEKVIPTGTRNARLAGTIRDQIVREITEGKRDPWKPRGVQVRGAATFEEAAAAFLQERAGYLRPATLAAYGVALRGIGGRLAPGLRLDGVTAAHVRPYVTAPGVSAATRRHRMRHLRAFFRWCVEDRLCDDSPLDGLKLPKGDRPHPSFLTPEDVERLVAHLEATGATWLRDAVLVALCTGLRRGEACALRWSGVDLTPGRETITIRSGRFGFQTKSGHDVVRPLLGDALSVVCRLAESREASTERSDGPVLRGTRGGALGGHHVSRRFKAAARAAGLPSHVHFHSLRHTCATWLVRSGAPLPVVAKMLGHSSVQVTQIYTHVVTDDLRAFGRAAFDRG